MSVQRSREPDALAPLPEELEQAVAGLRAFVEPTPQQLELSYRRVQQALGGVAPAAISAVAPSPAAAPPAAVASVARSPAAVASSRLPLLRLPPKAASAERALRARRALWAFSGGVTTVALLAGFAIGRWTRVAPTSLEAQVATATVPALAPLKASAQTAHSVEPAPVGGSSPASGDGSALVEGNFVLDGMPVVEGTPVSEGSPVKDGSPVSERGPLIEENGSRVATSRAVGDRSRVWRQTADAAELLCPARDPLLRAECLLRRQHPQRALAALRRASLKTERETERVLGLTLLARCQLGQEVRSLGKRFFEQWPASPLTWRIRNECPSAEPSSEATLQRAEVPPAWSR